MSRLDEKYLPLKQVFVAINEEGRPVIVDENGKIKGPYLTNIFPVEVEVKWSLFHPEDCQRLNWAEII